MRSTRLCALVWKKAKLSGCQHYLSINDAIIFAKRPGYTLNVSICFISISHRLAIKQDWSNDMRKHSRRNRYFSGEIESEREQIRCYMEFEEWKREGLTLYLVACAVRVLKQYGILGDMDRCVKFFFIAGIIDFELSPDGWLLTGTIWIWRVPRG